MRVVVGTLFEREYHLGVAVLVNSLARAGFAGTVYAGFRGPLPPWSQGQTKALGENEWEMTVTPGIRLLFVLQNTSAHLTNLKPEFLLQIESRMKTESEAVVYCDPDIVINIDWRYIEEWLTCGVALCEDVNSPFTENHPRRVGWRRFFGKLGHPLQFRTPSYANGGWIGLTWEHRRLLEVWRDFLARITESLGGQDVVGISGGRTLENRYGFADCFRQPDQDALNAALEAHPEIPTSFLGSQAMGFIAGTPVVPHALGPVKPWNRHYLRDAITGVPPAAADKIFWQNVDGPLHPFSPEQINARRLELKLGAALGRLIQRH